MFDTKHFPGAKVFWHNGELYPWNTTHVHVMTHALHYGSSVFEGIRAYCTERGPAVFRLKEHIDRFYLSADVMNMKVPIGKEQFPEVIKQVMKENKLKAAYIRPNLFNGYGNLGLTPKFSPPQLTIACWAWGAYLGSDAIEKGVHTLILPRRRIHISQMDMRAKIGGMYAQSNINATYAREMGYNEGIFLNIEGRIAEGPGENILIVKDNVVKTNDVTESILEGITRTTNLKLAEDLGYKVEIGPMTVEEFLNADEAFFCGTAAEVTPIVKVTDGSDPKAKPEDWKTYTIGKGVPGPVTRQLAQRYGDVVRGKLPEYDHWLTYVYDSKEEAEAALKDVE